MDSPTGPAGISWTGLSEGTQYFFRVRATNSCGVGGWVTNNFTTASTVDTTAPTVPTGLTVEPTGVNYEAKLSWNPATDNVKVQGYAIRRNVSDIVADNIPAPASGPVSILLSGHSHLVGGYLYQVQSIDAAGNRSLWSDVISYNQPAPTPSQTVCVFGPDADANGTYTYSGAPFGTPTWYKSGSPHGYSLMYFSYSGGGEVENSAVRLPIHIHSQSEWRMVS